MKALIQTAYGDPDKVLELQEVRDPMPREQEVVVGIEAALVRMADVHTVAGRLGFRKPLPRTPGYEGIGRVLQVGPNVSGLQEGQRVLAPLGAGTHREQICVPAGAVTAAPEGNAEHLALLALNPAAAWMMLHQFNTLGEGDWIVQNAANSSVGRIIIQLAAELKLRVINVVKSATVAAELEQEGAHAVLLDDEQLVQRVSVITKGAPVRLGLDAIGGPATARVIMCLAEGGVAICHGAMSGAPCEVPYDVIATRDIRVIGFNTARQLARCSAEERHKIFERLGKLVAAGRLRAKVAGVYDIDKAIDAYLHAARVGDKRFGSVVIRFRELPPPKTDKLVSESAAASGTDAGAAAPVAAAATTAAAPAAATAADGAGASAPAAGPAGTTN